MNRRGLLVFILRDVAARDVERGRHLSCDEEPGAECEAKERARFQRGTRMRDGRWERRLCVLHSCRWSPQWEHWLAARRKASPLVNGVSDVMLMYQLVFYPTVLDELVT